MPKIPEPTIIRSKRRTVAMQILPDATLVVKAPLHTPHYFIRKFIEENTAWIEKKMNQMQARPKAEPKTYAEGSTFLYLGKYYTLGIGNYSGIKIQEDKLLFPAGAQFRIKKELETWLIKQARTVISEQVAYYAQQMNASYIDLEFSDTKSQWGRCTHDNRLQFNWRLIMAPLLVINYVVIHELAHTKEKNHSRAFWSKVRNFNPSYRQQIKWLKENGSTLVI